VPVGGAYNGTPITNDRVRFVVDRPTALFDDTKLQGAVQIVGRQNVELVVTW